MKLFLIAVCFGAAILTSCSTLTKTANVANGVNTDVIINPIVANVDMDNAVEVQGSASSTYLLFLQISGGRKTVETPNSSALPFLMDRVGKVKNAAIYNALSEQSFDIIAHPRYTTVVTTHLFGLIKTYQVDVVGYGANISEFKQIQPGEPEYDALLYKNGASSVILQTK